MSRSRRNNGFLTKTLCVVAAILAVVLAASFIGNIGAADDDGYKTIHPTYSIGGLDTTTGRPTDEKCAIYTKDIIECTGIKLYADFDSDIKYVVHFYDENEEWIACEENEGLNSAFEGLDAEIDGKSVYGVRIAIYPQNDENDKVSFLEKATYGNQLTVKITTEETKVATTAE